MIATVDTKVLVSGILFGGHPGEIVAAATDRVFTLALSRPIIDELVQVLTRPKFGLNPDAVQVLIDDIQTTAIVVHPKKTHRIIAADPDDDAVIDCAVEAGASYIVSGDSHLTELQVIAGIEVITPAEFIRINKASQVRRA